MEFKFSIAEALKRTGGLYFSPNHSCPLPLPVGKSSVREEKVTARLLSVNVGLPRDIAWQGKTVHTAVWKTPVHGRRIVQRLNIDGDGQGDLFGHGGEHLRGDNLRTKAYSI